MSTDYRFTVKRKADGKVLGEFYYNRIKSLYNVPYDTKLKCDPEKFAPRFVNNSKNPRLTKLTTDDITSDIEKLEDTLDKLNTELFEKKPMIPQAANLAVKHEIEEDIGYILDDIKNVLFAIEALSGLEAAVSLVTEDMVKPDAKDDDDQDECMAYSYNSADLPKNEDGSRRFVWTHDVYIEPSAEC